MSVMKAPKGSHLLEQQSQSVSSPGIIFFRLWLEASGKGLAWTHPNQPWVFQGQWNSVHKQREPLGKESHNPKHHSSKGRRSAPSKASQRKFRNQAEDNIISIWEICA